MTNRFFDPERPPVGDHRRRRWLVERLVDYIIEGHSSVTANESEAPVFGMRLEQDVRPVGSREAIIIYVTMGEWAPSPDAPLIRRIRWDREQDRILSQHGSVLWPSLQDELFRLRRTDLSKMDGLVDQLGRRLPLFRTDASGTLDLAGRYIGIDDSAPSGEATGDSGEAINPPLIWRLLDYGALRLRWLGEHDQSEVDGAFVKLWGFLQTVCSDSNMVDYEYYHFGPTPKAYAEALRVLAAKLD